MCLYKRIYTPIDYSVVLKMGRLISVLFATILVVHYTTAISKLQYVKVTQYENVNEDEPLILTALIEAGKIEEAQNACVVDPSLFLGVESYSGYLTVDKDFNSNLFFWLFPSENDFENDPVIIWLQGGPGSTSMFGLFAENGPLKFSSKGELQLNEYSWNKNHSVVYIDNPAGTGWSFSEKGGYAQNQTKVGEGLYSALTQFFTLFPKLQDNGLFITGESYGGKYIPAIAYTIYKNNPEADLKINLQGIAIGNGWSDPINQIAAYGDYLFELGFIDDISLEYFKQQQNEIAEFIRQGNYAAAGEINDALLGDYFYNVSGIANVYNYLVAVDPSPVDGYISKFLQQSNIRTAIHVGNAQFEGEPVYENLQEDILKSITPWLAELICNYRVLLYSGQMDIIVAYPTTLNFLKKLDFCGSDEYKTAERTIWYVDGELAGYSKVAGNLTEALVRNAGHMVPSDQPKWALDLINKFVRGLPIA